MSKKGGQCRKKGVDWALIFIHKLNIQLSYCRGCLLSSLSVKRLLETDLIDDHVLLYSTVLITPSSDTTRWCDLIIHLIYAKSSLLRFSIAMNHKYSIY